MQFVICTVCLKGVINKSIKGYQDGTLHVSIQSVYSCKDAALQVLIWVCLSVFVSVAKFKFYLLREGFKKKVDICQLRGGGQKNSKLQVQGRSTSSPPTGRLTKTRPGLTWLANWNDLNFRWKLLLVTFAGFLRGSVFFTRSSPNVTNKGQTITSMTFKYIDDDLHLGYRYLWLYGARPVRLGWEHVHMQG